MPEDDFDIYGEDDGFSTKPVGVSATAARRHIACSRFDLGG